MLGGANPHTTDLLLVIPCRDDYGDEHSRRPLVPQKHPRAVGDGDPAGASRLSCLGGIAMTYPAIATRAPAADPLAAAAFDQPPTVDATVRMPAPERPAATGVAWLEVSDTDPEGA